MSALAIAGIAVLVAAAAAAAAWYAGQAVLLRRVRVLLNAANRVRAGDFSVRVRPPAGQGELSQLGTAFDAMAEALQQRDTELRQAVLELHAQANTDPLTRLCNRRQLAEMLPRELMRARHKNGTVAALMIDLDHFKNVNDTYGHKAGDGVLSEVGKLLRSVVRGSDIACRFGGEEMSLVLADTTLKVAAERAESIRLRIGELRIAHDGGELSVTASIGVAVFPDHADDAEGLLRAADQALYRAKREGRDRIAVAQRSDPAP